MNYELDYKELILKVLTTGNKRETRNGKTLSLFGQILKVDLSEGFPLLTSRQMFYKGVLGELVAMLNKPKHLKDFEKFGCNYWKLWANPDGTINVDYGNKWLDWNGINQLEQVIETIKTNPTDRRMLITGWDPSSLDNLDLPCCHYAYQFYVNDGKLHMLWHQRSADVMIGIPSDVVFAATWLSLMANETKLIPGTVTFTFGDTHIYEEHIEGAREFISRPTHESPSYSLSSTTVLSFVPAHMTINDYIHMAPIKFKLKA